MAFLFGPVVTTADGLAPSGEQCDVGGVASVDARAVRIAVGDGEDERATPSADGRETSHLAQIAWGN
jgi:hypothetical protein